MDINRLHFSVVFKVLTYNEAMRILVVEDEDRIANSIKKGLEMEKYTVAITYQVRSEIQI